MFVKNWLIYLREKYIIILYTLYQKTEIPCDFVDCLFDGTSYEFFV